MSRSAISVLLSRTLIATAAFCATFAAHSASLEPSAPLNGSPTGSNEKTSASAADAQQDAQTVPCESHASTAEQDDQAYLLETASPGDTMMRQGPDTAIARLNPEFVARLASAIRDARQSGLPSAGIFSAYRPPAFGVGGFSDKFKSLHAYGLAVDISGIGEPGSKEAKLWHEIAARHGVFCPYGADSKTEWNHCQAIQSKEVSPDNPLRKTITAQGPRQLEEMFTAGKSAIEDLPAAISVAVVANEAKDSAAVRQIAPSASTRDLRHSHHGRRGLGEALARGGRSAKTKMIMLAKNEASHGEKYHRKSPEEAKAHGLHKAARASAQSRHDSTRHRSHLA